MNQNGRFYVPLGSWVQLDVVNYDTGSHPMHLHGHRLWVVSSSDVPGGEYSNGPYFVQRDVATARRRRPSSAHAPTARRSRGWRRSVVGPRRSSGHLLRIIPRPLPPRPVPCVRAQLRARMPLRWGALRPAPPAARDPFSSSRGIHPSLGPPMMRRLQSARYGR